MLPTFRWEGKFYTCVNGAYIGVDFFRLWVSSVWGTKMTQYKAGVPLEHRSHQDANFLVTRCTGAVRDKKVGTITENLQRSVSI